MKRLAAAAVISVILHGIFLVLLLDRWVLPSPRSNVSTKRITFTMLDAPKTAVKAPPHKQPVKRFKKTSPAPKPEPPKPSLKPQKKVVPTKSPVSAPTTPPVVSHTAPQPPIAASPDLPSDAITNLLPGEAATNNQPEPLTQTGISGTNISSIPDRKAAPDYQKNPAPAYPKRARKRGYSGTVELEVLVSREGRVRDLRIHRSSGYGILDRAARNSVKEWTFTPGIRSAQPTEMWVIVPVRFELK